MRNPIVAMVSAAWFIALSLAANAATLYVECESFAELGGWVVDPHSMKALGSSYVMAHGIGKPVADAKTTVADLNERKVVDVFRHDSLDVVTSVCDLPDGGFLASVNPRGAKEKAV